MSPQAGVPIPTLEEIHQTLATELAALVVLGEQMLAEMDAIDDLRTAMTNNGTRLLAARSARREAARDRTTASQTIQRAIHTRQRACDLASEAGSVTSRARTLLGGRQHPTAPTSPHAEGAVAA